MTIETMKAETRDKASRISWRKLPDGSVISVKRCQGSHNDEFEWTHITNTSQSPSSNEILTHTSHLRESEARDLLKDLS